MVKDFRNMILIPLEDSNFKRFAGFKGSAVILIDFSRLSRELVVIMVVA